MRLPRPSFRVGLFLLLLVLGGGLALLDMRDDTSPGPVPRDAAGEPDYYLEGARLTRFDAAGRPHQQLQTPRLVHTPHDDVTRLTTPRARLLDDSLRVWLARSETGTLGPGGKRLTLEGNAELEAPAERWHLATEVLHYDTDAGHAWSATPVVLRQPPQTMRAERFDAWVDDSRVRLTDNVRGYHPPAPREEPAS